MDPRPEPNDARIVALLHRILAATTLEEAAQAAVQQLGAATQAVAAGCFLVNHGRAFLSAWYPKDRTGVTPAGVQLERLARAAPHPSAPPPFTLPDGSQLVPRVITAPFASRLSVVMGLASATAVPTPYAGVLDGLLEVVAARLRAIHDLDAERRRAGQYERWFRVADRQIRALDLERQKFAALARAISTGLFVTDRDGRIRWINEWLLALAPAPADGGSWLGATCDQLCRRLGGRAEPACAGCVTTRVLEDRRVTRATIVPESGAGDQVLSLTATPIRSLDGKVQEVMVSVQSMSRSSTLPAAEPPPAAGPSGMPLPDARAA